MKRTALGCSAAALAAWLLVGCQPQRAEPINGYVEAEFVRVAAPLSGRLVALSVQRGANVAAGAPLFVLEHDSESAAVDEAQARLTRAQAQVRDLSRGQRRDELAAAQAALDAARASLAQSNSDLKRERGLADSGFTSGAALTAALAKRDADDARVRQLEAQLRSAHQGARDDAQAAARADAEAARASLDQSRWKLAQKTVVAPVAAQVDDTLYRVGEWVNAGSPVVSLLEPGALKLRFFVPEPLLAQVKPGTVVQAGCDGCGAPFKATVRHVASDAEFTPPVIYSKESRQRLLFLVEAWPLPEDAARLRAGLPVQVQLANPR
ncbi:MAG TPA: HlyD family efflux transporter periplasmic adaptor subunit [Albitalea sp.]|nr:HlyD family efflux transporter periplasmic adaptor subunit [Albitalea sp.]